MNQPLNINELVLKRVEAKRQEDQASKLRKELDEQIAALLPKPADKGTASVKLDDLSIKVTVTYGSSTTVDADALRQAAAKLPQSVVDAFRWKPEVEAAKWKALSPADLLIAAKYVTTKPSSPSVKLEVV